MFHINSVFGIASAILFIIFIVDLARHEAQVVPLAQGTVTASDQLINTLGSL